jgi:hypothetical protein
VHEVFAESISLAPPADGHGNGHGNGHAVTDGEGERAVTDGEGERATIGGGPAQPAEAEENRTGEGDE